MGNRAKFVNSSVLQNIKAEMKLAVPLVFLYVMVASYAQGDKVIHGDAPHRDKEYVRGGDLVTIQGYLWHIEGHHKNLEKFEDNLESIKKNAIELFEAEEILEEATDPSHFANAWKHN